MSDNGFIKLHRSITKWEWYQDNNTFSLFIHLLLTANFKDSRWQGIEIKRGQILTGRKQLAKETRLSEQVIRTCLERLKSTNEITIKSTSKYSLITIVKYSDYQDYEHTSNQQNNQHFNQQVTNHQPTSNQQVTTIEECKERKERKEDIDLCIIPSAKNSIFNIFEEELGRTLSSIEIQTIFSLQEKHGEKDLLNSLRECLISGMDKKISQPIPYISKILANREFQQ